MKVAVCCTGIGPYSTGDFIKRSARAAEEAGFSGYFTGEHVMWFGAYPESKYPYGGVTDAWGDPSDPDPRAPFPDPVLTMSWAAAATETIEVGTCILILPQRNPLVLAKELSTLDEFSGGRVTLGAGVGWCKEESDAIGMDWKSRGKRMDEYIDVMRTLWQSDRADFAGPAHAFENAYMYPKPAHDSTIPVIIGGDTDIALRRVARTGDGWLAFDLPVPSAAGRVATLKGMTREAGRDPEKLRIVASIFSFTPPEALEIYRAAGITEFLLFQSCELPLEQEPMRERLFEMAERFVVPTKDW